MAVCEEVFGREEFVSIFSGDEELVKDVLAGFLASCEELCGAIEAAAGTGDVESLVFAAHKLKGSSANVRAPRLSGVCDAFERALAESPEADPSHHVRAVTENFQSFRSAVLSCYPDMAGRLRVSTEI